MERSTRDSLVSLSARVDQLLAEADAHLRDPESPNEFVRAEKVREQLLDARARVERHLA